MSAKGRVAAWLDGIDPEVPPMDASPSLLPTTTPAADLGDKPTEALVTIVNVKPEKEVSLPNPRSSGFVPIGTLKNDEVRRRSGIEEQPHDIVMDDIGLPLTSPLTQISHSPKVDHVVPSHSDALNVNAQKSTSPARA